MQEDRDRIVRLFVNFAFGTLFILINLFWRTDGEKRNTQGGERLMKEKNAKPQGRHDAKENKKNPCASAPLRPGVTFPSVKTENEISRELINFGERMVKNGIHRIVNGV